MKAYIINEKGIVLIGNKAYQPNTGIINNIYEKWAMSLVQPDRLYKVKSSNMNTAKKLLKKFRTKELLICGIKLPIIKKNLMKKQKNLLKKLKKSTKRETKNGK